MEAKFILSKSRLKEQLNILKNSGLKISYSYKTNREVGDILQEISDCDFSIHSREEIGMIKDRKRIWFFTQAESENELKEILDIGVGNFVVDNETDMKRLLKTAESESRKINLSLRMKFMEHRIGTGKYFVYGLDSRRINKIIREIKDNKFIEKLGVHIHRKSQNVSEWEIAKELEDSLNKETLGRINFLNLGGGLPVRYRNCQLKTLNYIFDKIREAKKWLDEREIEAYIEPGRFLAAPCIKLETEIIQIYGRTIVINTSIYNCALDTLIGDNKMLIENELEDGEEWLIKGNSPTRDDIFRYRVKLKNPKTGDKIVFLNAGAYNYATDFFGYKKLKTEIAN